MPAASPPPPFGRRLLQARKMQGLSLRDLAARLEGRVSHNALSKYEKGLMMPGSEVLIAIASALDSNPDFFFREFEVEISNISFRKRSSLRKKDQYRIVEESRDFFERYLELEEILGIRKAFENPLSQKRVSTVEQAENAAAALRSHWRLGRDALPNVHELLEEKNVKVHESPDAPREFDGLCGEADGSRVVVLGAWLDSFIPRKRLTLVHELAHLLLEIPGDMPEKEQERLVNRFAGAFLLPREAMDELLGPNRSQVSLQELVEIKAVYGISIKAIVMRARQLGYIGPQSFKNFCIFYNKQSWKDEGEPGDDGFSNREKSHRFRTLVYRALSENRISMTKAATILGKPLDQVRNEFSIVT